MLQSFLVYGLLALILFFLGREISIKEAYSQTHFQKEKIFLSWEMVFMLLLFGFVVGVRWDVGVDHLSYLKIYKDYINFKQFDRDNLEIGYIFITKLFATLNLHFSFYFAFWGILQMLFLYLAFKNNKYLYPYIGLILILGPLFLSWNNGMRQTLATCIFMFGAQYIVDRKFLKYLFWVFIASLFHKSAWIVLPFYFIPINKILISNRFLQLTILFICIYLGFNQFWIHELTRFGDLLSFIGYERYSENLDMIIYDEVFKNFGIKTTFLLLINVVIIIFSKSILNSYNDKKFNLYYNLFFIGICLYYLLFNTSHIFLRVLYYFDIVKLLFSALMLHFLYFKSKLAYIIRVPLFLILFLLSISYTFGSVYEAMIGVDNSILYKFFWNY